MIWRSAIILWPLLASRRKRRDCLGVFGGCGEKMEETREKTREEMMGETWEKMMGETQKATREA